MLDAITSRVSVSKISSNKALFFSILGLWNFFQKIYIEGGKKNKIKLVKFNSKKKYLDRREKKRKHVIFTV